MESLIYAMYKNLVGQGMDKGEAIRAMKQLVSARREFRKQEAAKVNCKKG